MFILGSASEHGCLGNVTFNIGLALSRGHRYMEACSLLSVACKQLNLSCDQQGAASIQRVSTPL